MFSRVSKAEDFVLSRPDNFSAMTYWTEELNYLNVAFVMQVLQLTIHF